MMMVGRLPCIIRSGDALCLTCATSHDHEKNTFFSTLYSTWFYESRNRLIYHPSLIRTLATATGVMWLDDEIRKGPNGSATALKRRIKLFWPFGIASARKAAQQSPDSSIFEQHNGLKIQVEEDRSETVNIEKQRNTKELKKWSEGHKPRSQERARIV